MNTTTYESWNYEEPLMSEHCDGCGTAFDYTISIDENGRETEDWIVAVDLPSGRYCGEKCARTNG